MPNVVHVWEEHGGENFLVVGINLDSKHSEDDMYEMIEEQGITFPNITELMGFASPLARGRGVNYVPQNYLLAPDGTVLMRDLREEKLVDTIDKIMVLDEPYRPIIMKIEVQNDPREEDGFIEWSPDRDRNTRPFVKPLNIAPDELHIRIHVENYQADRFEATLTYYIERPTGRRTHWIKDQVTKDVYCDYWSGEPEIYYEAELEKVEVVLQGRDGEINTGYVIPLGEDVWEVYWGLKVYSPLLDLDIGWAYDDINFARFYTIEPEEIEEQGGIYFKRDEK